MVLSPHPALLDAATICARELGELAAVVIAQAAADASENSVHNAEALREDEDLERVGALQAWNYIWLSLARECPKAFSRSPRALSAVGVALLYALGGHERGLAPLELNAAERRQLAAGRRHLCEATGLRSMRRACVAHLITDRCEALRAYVPVALPGRVGISVGHEPSLRRHVLLLPQSIPGLRETVHDGVSDLILVLLHEELHVAFASASRGLGAERHQPLALAAEEAVVSLLDLAAGHLIRTGVRPTRRQLLALAPTGSYPETASALLRSLPAEDLLASLTRIGLAATEGTDETAAAALNRAASRDVPAARWRRELSLDSAIS